MKDLDDYPKACHSWRHKWVIQKQEVFPSLLEQIDGRTFNSKGFRENPAHKSSIVTYVCYRCGSEKVERI